MQYFLPFWYGKVPMFWLPHGWFPYWVEWILSFPRSPIGSVSIASWQLACTGVLKLLGEVVVGLVGAVKQKEGKRMEQPVKADTTKKEKAKPDTGKQEKKEL